MGRSCLRTGRRAEGALDTFPRACSHDAMSTSALDSTKYDPPPQRPSLRFRLRVAAGLVAGLRKPDFQAAGVFVQKQFGGRSFPIRWARFIKWTLNQMFVAIPNALQHATADKRVSTTPMWLIDTNPLADHPWKDTPGAALATEADTAVIGGGFTGGAMAYHWSRRAPEGRKLVLLEMGDPSSGSSGRNEGLVVMGRYFKTVRDTVKAHLPAARPDLDDRQHEQMARQFAAVYCRAAYANAERIEQTIRSEGFDCDYAREGWVQSVDAAGQASLDESVRLALELGFKDWTTITPQEVLERSGMHVRHNAGLSLAAASWHPAKWVWCLLGAALRKHTVQLFTRTTVRSVQTAADHYEIDTNRGTIRARHVVNATESYTPKLHRQFHDAILPIQEQAACGDGGPTTMKPHVGISGGWFFAGRYGPRVLFGSGGSRLKDDEAGRNHPSRFLSKFVLGQLHERYGPFRMHLTNEWSGTVGYTPDEYPIVGLIDGRGHYVIAGMCGSGSGVSFNAARCVCNRILNVQGEPDDYPEAYFAPSRLLVPKDHPWPQLDPDMTLSSTLS